MVRQTWGAAPDPGLGEMQGSSARRQGQTWRQVLGSVGRRQRGRKVCDVVGIRRLGAGSRVRYAHTAPQRQPLNRKP